MSPSPSALEAARQRLVNEEVAIRSAIAFVLATVKPLRCDSEAVSDCLRCTAKYLANRMNDALAAALSLSPPPPREKVPCPCCGSHLVTLPDSQALSCHVCGNLMERGWQCKECGATSYPSGSADRGRLLALYREKRQWDGGGEFGSDSQIRPREYHSLKHYAADVAIEKLEAELEARRAAAPVETPPPDIEALLALEKLVNTPELIDFSKAVHFEAVHQVGRWGSEHDAGKEPEDWFWLVGYLAGKALSSWKFAVVVNDSDPDLAKQLREKTLHHIITTAAALNNWHAQILGASNMRPGLVVRASGEPE